MQRVPAMKFTLELDTKSLDDSMIGTRRYIWRLLHPIPPSIGLLLGDKPMGTWTQNSVGFYLYPQSNRSNLLMELRQVGNNDPNGPAFGLPQNNAYALRGIWSASAKPLPKTWIGVMGKGSAGLFLGAEGGVGALVALDLGGFGKHGVVFSVGTGRVITGGGFSGGLALVIATGFENARKFDNYSSDGADWALSIGENFKGLAASGKLASVTPVLKTLSAIQTSADKADAYRKIVCSKDFGKEIYGVMKGVMQTALVDTDYQNVTAIDVPLAGAGTEAGFYYAWSKYNLLTSW